MKKAIFIIGILAINTALLPHFIKDNISADRREVKNTNIDPKDLVNNLDNLVYSRNETEEEIKRRQELEKDYFDYKIKPIKKLSERTSADELYYDNENRQLILPEREMTDDELLALIDFWADINRLCGINSPKPDEDDISEERAIQLAKEYAKKIMDIDLSEYKADAVFNTKQGYIEKDCWTVVFGGTEPDYFIYISADNGEFMSIDTLISSKLFPEREKAAGISLSEKESIKKIAQNDIKLYSGNQNEVIELYIPKYKGESVVVFLSDSEKYYIIEYSYPTNQKISFYVYDDENNALNLLKNCDPL